MKIKRIILITLVIMLGLAFLTGLNVEATGSYITGNFGGSEAPTGTEPIVKIISAVLGIVRIVGSAVAVVMLMTIAAKYIIASAGDRADIKKYALNYVIGAVILFGTSGIIGIIQKAVNSSIKYGS